MIVTLKACPFCGKNDLIIKGDAEGSWIYCNYCGVENDMDEIETVVARRNTRKVGETSEYTFEEE